MTYHQTNQQVSAVVQFPSAAHYPHVVQHPEPQIHAAPAPAVIVAPVARYGYGPSFPPPNSGAWTSGLCGCCDDCFSCCLGCCCPCVLVGKSVEMIDRGQSNCCVGGTFFFLLQYLCCLGCLYTCIYRGRLRRHYGLPDTCGCGDCCTDCWCLYCSICQVYREIDYRQRIAGPRGAYQSNTCRNEE
ncbi:hypothetical protein Mapa_016201 [Marchantia paleacea]|nr:hypothetical protein Mapa_016201 [Marchantia paleacea]